MTSAGCFLPFFRVLGHPGDTGTFTIRGAQVRNPAGCQLWEWLTDPSLSVCIFCSLQTFVLHNNRCIWWERTTVGGGVVKVLILQFFFRYGYGNGLHMKPQITTVQNTTFSAEMLSLSKNVFICCLAFWKRKRVYIQWFWCLQWILHCILVQQSVA